MYGDKLRANVTLNLKNAWKEEKKGKCTVN